MYVAASINGHGTLLRLPCRRPATDRRAWMARERRYEFDTQSLPTPSPLDQLAVWLSCVQAVLLLIADRMRQTRRQLQDETARLNAVHVNVVNVARPRTHVLRRQRQRCASVVATTDGGGGLLPGAQRSLAGVHVDVAHHTQQRPPRRNTLTG